METWSRWSSDLRGAAIPTGHYPAEQRPDIVGPALLAFFSGKEPELGEAQS
jgi:haloacetate dehalogenase